MVNKKSIKQRLSHYVQKKLYVLKWELFRKVQMTQ